MSWTDIAKRECETAAEKLLTAETLLGLALKAFRAKPTHENEIALKAAKRLVKESRSRLEEWTL